MCQRDILEYLKSYPSVPLSIHDLSEALGVGEGSLAKNLSSLRRSQSIEVFNFEAVNSRGAPYNLRLYYVLNVDPVPFEFKSIRVIA